MIHVKDHAAHCPMAREIIIIRVNTNNYRYGIRINFANFYLRGNDYLLLQTVHLGGINERFHAIKTQVKT